MRQDPAPEWLVQLDAIVDTLVLQCRRVYGDRLISFVLYGSVARGTPRRDSDIDFLIVADPLPDGRRPRLDEFSAVEESLGPILQRAHADGLDPFIAPLIKTPLEAEYGTPIFLDMIDDGRILFDRDGFMRSRLDRLEARLKALGARRLWRDGASFWDLKPDYRPGDVIEL